MTGADTRTGVGASSEQETPDFDDFFENSVAAMHWLGADGTILHANQAELDLLGYCRGDVIGRPIAEFHVDRAAIEGVLARLLRGERLVKSLAKLRAKDGSVKHVRMSSSAQFRGGAFIKARCVSLDLTAELQAEADLRESERRFRAVLDAMPAAIYTTDRSGRITYYNDAASDLWGHRPELSKSEWCGSWRLFWPDGSSMPHDRSPMAVALQEKRPIRGIEAIAERPDGTRVRVVPCPTPIFDASGALLGAVNMLVDLTDRRRVEDVLRARRAELEAVINRTPFMLIRCGRDLRYRFVSEAYAQMLGRRPADLVGKPIVEIIGQKGFNTILPYVNRVLQGQCTEHDTEVHLEGIGPRFLRSVYTPEADEQGNTQGWIASLLDVSDRKRSEQVRQQLASIVDSSDDAIMSTDLDGVIVSWNHGAARLFGYSAEQAVGKPITILIPAELQEEEPRLLERIRRAEHIDHYETIHRRREGGIIHVSLSLSPMKNAEGRVIGASQIARDITERKRAEEHIASDLHAMTLLRQVGSQCVREGDKLEKCLNGIIDAAIAIMGADKANIQLIDPALGTLTIAAQRGFERPFLQFFDSLGGDGSAGGITANSTGHVIVEDVLQSEILLGRSLLRLLDKAGVRSIISSQLISSSGKSLGVISTCFTKPRRPSERELSFLDLLVRQSADYVERRRAETALAKRAEQQTALYEFTNRLYRAESLDVVYDAALDAILGALGCHRASILRLDERGVMRFVAWRGLSDGYRQIVEGHSPWLPDASNPEPVCFDDIRRADLPTSLKRVVEGEGIGALAFIPLAAHGKLTGKFMTYYETPHAFHKDEIDLALNLARQLGFAAERMQAEHARQVAEQELRKLSEKWESEVEKRTLERDRIWNVSEDLLAVSTFEGYFLSINPAWTKLLGWTEDEIKSMHVGELRHPEDAAHSMAGRAQLAQGIQSVRMENRLRHKDGSWCWIQWTMSAENELIYISGRHVTLEKEAAAALERAQRQSAHSQKMEALGQLTGGVAHDFNNLLMIVSGHAQSLKRRLSEARDIRVLEAIQIASTRGESLTRQLLSFSRNQPLSPTVICPAEVVNAIRDVLAGSLHVNIELSIDVPDTIWPIRVDKSEVELALVNLAVNARDAMPDGGRVAIAAENVCLKSDDTPDGLAGDFVALSVTDTGSGIPDDLLTRVFEPFFTTKGADKGTGLGLSQVYGFARRSGGTVVIKGRLPRGTQVTIYLPRTHSPIDLPIEEDSSRWVAHGEETILVVEDNNDVRTVTVSLLEQLGYRTIAVETAHAAVEVLESGCRPSLIFTDVVLPGETDGLAFARTVKTRHSHIPVVLTTGYAKVFDSDSEFPVLRKPYQISTLARVMREVLDRSRAGPTGLES
jgi:PAS domain S-box-containing protein